MAPEETVRLRITGGVQGVGYRIWATRTASGLGLRGWVRNRSDGSVEALATGAPEQVAGSVFGAIGINDRDPGRILLSTAPEPHRNHCHLPAIFSLATLVVCLQ